MSILKKLAEQAIFNFTGRVNLLAKENNQHIALVFLREGKLVNAYYENKVGLKAILSLIFDEVEGKVDLRFMPEPELISEKELLLNLDIEELKRTASSYYNDFQNAKNLRPPENVRLIPNPDFILNGADIDFREFSLLCNLTQYNTVEDIYNNSEFVDHETTMLLVSLRKKKAISVVAA